MDASSVAGLAVAAAGAADQANKHKGALSRLFSLDRDMQRVETELRTLLGKIDGYVERQGKREAEVEGRLARIEERSKRLETLEQEFDGLRGVIKNLNVFSK